MKLNRSVIIGAILAAAAAGQAFAAFTDSGWGVRPLGMAGAFTAVANDSNATMYNPAGITQMDKLETTFMSAKLFTGLDGVEIGQNYFSYVYPMSQNTGNIGMTWASLYTPELYREDTFALSYGKNISGLLKLEKTQISLGTNLKYLRHEYTLDKRTAVDPVFLTGTSAGNFSLDLATLVAWPEEGLSVALMSKNVNTPDVGLKSADKVPNENVAGFAYYTEKMDRLDLEYFTFALDVVSREDSVNIRTGVESWFFDGKFATRLGFQMQAVTMGFGYEFALWPGTDMIVDYAFAWPLELEKTLGTHRMGITLRLP
jgi:hypothetical protein